VVRVLERRTLAATLILNVEDAFARERLGSSIRRRPLEPLQFRLVDRTVGGNFGTFTPPRDLVITRNASGYHLFFGRERLADGSTAVIEMPGGLYTIEIESPPRFYQTRQRTVPVPMPNPNVIDATSADPAKNNPMSVYSFDLEPGHAYPFPDTYPFQIDANPAGCSGGNAPAGGGVTLLRGSLHQVDGTGIAAARVEVAGVSNVFETDESGDWVLWFPDAHPTGLVSVSVTLPGAAATNVPGVCVVRGRDASLHETSLRGWMRRQGIGVGGAEIRVSGHAERSRTAADGSWSYYFGLNQPDEIVDVTAVLPGGDDLTRTGIAVKRRGTVLVPPFMFV